MRAEQQGRQKNTTDTFCDVVFGYNLFIKMSLIQLMS